jgi:hypothetical protein
MVVRIPATMPIASVVNPLMRSIVAMHPKQLVDHPANSVG